MYRNSEWLKVSFSFLQHYIRWARQAEEKISRQSCHSLCTTSSTIPCLLQWVPSQPPIGFETLSKTHLPIFPSQQVKYINNCWKVIPYPMGVVTIQIHQVIPLFTRFELHQLVSSMELCISKKKILLLLLHAPCRFHQA